MNEGIFSTYRQGENRVTSTILKVLANLPINIVDKFLQLLSEDGGRHFFSFENQPKGESSQPDGFIHAQFGLMIETKTVTDSIRPDQLENHVELAKRKAAQLVYLTPDLERPKKLKQDDYKYVVWKSFDELHSLISELIADETLTISERDQFLLRSLQLMFEEDGLIKPKDLTVVIAASKAWTDYNQFGIYVCQPNRQFRGARYLAFYADQEIKPVVPEILQRWENIDLTDEDGLKEEKISGHLLENVERYKKRYNDDDALTNCQLVELTARDDANRTIKLDEAIKNDCKSKVSGRKVAFTQGQRYTTLDKLKTASTTSQLA